MILAYSYDPHEQTYIIVISASFFKEDVYNNKFVVETDGRTYTFFFDCNIMIERLAHKQDYAEYVLRCQMDKHERS